MDVKGIIDNAEKKHHINSHQFPVKNKDMKRIKTKYMKNKIKKHLVPELRYEG
jgi:hypothetical protein